MEILGTSKFIIEPLFAENGEPGGDKDAREGGEKDKKTMKDFLPCPVVPNSEFEDWCRPWKGSLVVHVLGKRLNFKSWRLIFKKTGQGWKIDNS